MRHVAAVSGFVLLWGCASGKPASSLLRSDWAPAAEQRCELVTTPATLPAADDLLALPAALAALSSVALEAGRDSGWAVLEVMFDSAGTRDRARLLDTTLTPEVAEQLLGTVVTAAPEASDERGRSWGVLVKATAEAEEATFEVERMEYCACALTNRREFTRLLGSALQEVRIPELAGTSRTIVIDVRSDTTGAIVEKRLHQSTGYVELDRWAVALADRMSVAPPLLNRQPVEMWSRLPITLNFPE